MKETSTSVNAPLSSICSPVGFCVSALTLLLGFSLCQMAVAVSPPPDGGYPGGNTAEGTQALQSVAGGGYDSAFGFQALFHTTANFNTGLGFRALFSDTTGTQNTATGVQALFSNTTGNFNTAVGLNALYHNVGGSLNTATGTNALINNTAGFNTANGVNALYHNTTGTPNTAIGVNALFNNTTGGGNIAIGASAGYNLTTGNNNIDIGHQGVAAETGFIRLGTVGTHTATLLSSPVGVRLTTAPASTLHILHPFGSITNGLRLQNEFNNHQWNFYTTSTGTLELSADGTIVGNFNPTTGAYTATSDRRMKKDIEKVGDVLPQISQLKVIKYHSLEAAPQDRKYYGLVAQEVEPLFPELVSYNPVDGSKEERYTMNYSAFGVIAIKAIQEQQEEIRSLEDRVAKLEAALAKITEDK
jgi:trimeric autotransporter adhesin